MIRLSNSIAARRERRGLTRVRIVVAIVGVIVLLLIAVLVPAVRQAQIAAVRMADQ